MAGERASWLVFRNYFVEGRPLLGSPGVHCVRVRVRGDGARERTCACARVTRGRAGFRVPVREKNYERDYPGSPFRELMSSYEQRSLMNDGTLGKLAPLRHERTNLSR